MRAPRDHHNVKRDRVSLFQCDITEIKRKRESVLGLLNYYEITVEFLSAHNDVGGVDQKSKVCGIVGFDTVVAEIGAVFAENILGYVIGIAVFCFLVIIGGIKISNLLSVGLPGIKGKIFLMYLKI